MHCPTASAAQQARLSLQRAYEFYLGMISGFSSFTPHMVLTKLGLLPLQVFWWQQPSNFEQHNMLACGGFFDTVLLDNLYDAVHNGAFNFTSAVAACLHKLGVSMPIYTDRVPALDVPNVSDLLKADLEGLSTAVVLPTAGAEL